MALPVAVSPKYFFAPIGGWKSDVLINPGETMFFLDPREWKRWDAQYLHLALNLYSIPVVEGFNA